MIDVRLLCSGPFLPSEAETVGGDASSVVGAGVHVTASTSSVVSGVERELVVPSSAATDATIMLTAHDTHTRSDGLVLTPPMLLELGDSFQPKASSIGPILSNESASTKHWKQLARGAIMDIPFQVGPLVLVRNVTSHLRSPPPRFLGKNKKWVLKAGRWILLYPMMTLRLYLHQRRLFFSPTENHDDPFLECPWFGVHGPFSWCF